MPNKSKECWKRRITLIESFDLEQLRKVVTQCGQAILDFERTDIVVLSNYDENKKTNLNVLINESMTHGLKMILDIPIISEEDDDRTVIERPRTYWLVDPIDGTRNYLDGFNTYVTQAALMLDSQPVIAVVYAPALDELFTAVKGEGAFKNNRRIQVSSNLVPEIIIDNYPSPNDFLRGVMENLSIKEYIECGSIALKICRVSEGAADVFVKNTRVHDWDVAPGELILNESGGKLGLTNGNNFEYKDNYRKPSLLATANQSFFNSTARAINENLNL